MYRLLAVLTIILSLSFLPAPVTAQGQELTQSWQIGGHPSALDAQGELAYVGVGDRLQVFDLSDPTTPKLIGKSQPFDRLVGYVDVEGKFAYVLTSRDLVVLDIANPTELKVVGKVLELNGYKIVVQGSYAYIAGSGIGVAVVDLSDPTEPKLVYSESPWDEYELAVAEKYLFQPAGSAIEAYTLEHPPQPKQISAFGETTPGQYVRVATSKEGRVLASTIITPSLEGNTILRVFDTNEIDNPTVVLERVFEEGINGLEIADEELFVTSYQGVVRYNLRNLSEPPVQKAHQGENRVVRKFEDGYVLLDGSDGFVTLNDGLSLLGTYTVPIGFARGVSCGTDLEVTSNNGLWTINPKTRGIRHTEVDEEYGLDHVAQNSRRVFVTDWNPTLYVFEGGELIDNMELDEHYWAINIEASDQLLIVTGLKKVYLYDPNTLRLWSWINMLASGAKLSEDGKVLYVSSRWSSVHIFDVSNVRKPREIGKVESPDHQSVAGFSLLPDSRLLTVGENFFWVFDVTDPASPKEIGRIDHREWFPSDSDVPVEVIPASDGKTVYLGFWNRVASFDITSGERTSYTKLKADIRTMCFAGGDLIVANEEMGLLGFSLGSATRTQLFLPLLQR